MIGMIKVYLQGESGAEPVPDIVAQVANEIYVQDLLSLLIIHMEKLEFEVCDSGHPACPSDLVFRHVKTLATSTVRSSDGNSGPALPQSSTCPADPTSSSQRSNRMRTQRSPLTRV